MQREPVVLLVAPATSRRHVQHNSVSNWLLLYAYCSCCCCFVLTCTCWLPPGCTASFQLCVHHCVYAHTLAEPQIVFCLCAVMCVLRSHPGHR